MSAMPGCLLVLTIISVWFRRLRTSMLPTCELIIRSLIETAFTESIVGMWDFLGDGRLVRRQPMGTDPIMVTKRSPILWWKPTLSVQAWSTNSGPLTLTILASGADRILTLTLDRSFL